MQIPRRLTYYQQFFDFGNDSQTVVVRKTTCRKAHIYIVTSSMVPLALEVMVTKCNKTRYCFHSYFGTQYEWALFTDEVNLSGVDDARRYYTSLMGKLVLQVQTLLKRPRTGYIQMICPLRPCMALRISAGMWTISYLQIAFTPEGSYDRLRICYEIQRMRPNILACRLADRGVRNIAVYDVSLLSENPFRSGKPSAPSSGISSFRNYTGDISQICLEPWAT